MAKSIVHVVTAFVLLWDINLSASVIGNLAAAMPARSFVKVPTNASLNALNLSYALFYWGDSGVWDPVETKVHIVTNPGACCGDQKFVKLSYSDATDTWQLASTPYSGPGHSGDGNALDPQTGRHYFTRYNDNRVKRWDGSGWGELPNLPYSGVPFMGLAWFPEADRGKGALIHVGGNGQAAWFNGSQWASITGGQWGDYNTFAEYNPVHKVVWLGAGNGADRNAYRLDANFKLTALKNAPFSLNVDAALHSCDPVSGDYIITNLYSHEFWKFDIMSDEWSKIIVQGMPSLGYNESHNFQVPISDYGVILYFQDARDVYLYKHTQKPGAAVVGVPGAFAPVRSLFSAEPNPFFAEVNLRVFAADANGKIFPIKVYDMRGKEVARLSNGVLHSEWLEYLWQPSSLAAGVYLVQFQAGSTRFVRPLTLAR